MRFGALRSCRDASKLPGLSRIAWRLESDAIPQGDLVLSTPVSVVLHVSKEGDQSRYNYTLTKDARSAPWRLTQAFASVPGRPSVRI